MSNPTQNNVRQPVVSVRPSTTRLREKCTLQVEKFKLNHHTSSLETQSEVRQQGWYKARREWI
jgi:hypothetical protein